MSEIRFLWPPKALLPLKGRLDARKGQGAAEAYVDRTYQRLAVLVVQETMTAEKMLNKTRQDVSGHLADRNRTLEQLADLPPVREEDSRAAIRANRRSRQKRDSLRTALARCETEIISANETLIHTQTLLGERIARLQSLIQERINLYVMGVCSSRDLKTFICPQPEEDTWDPVSFLAGHQALDSEVRRIAEELIMRKEAA